MRAFKPLQLSLQHKTFSWQNKNQLAVSLLLGFPFDSEQEVLLEQDLWKFLSEQLGSDNVLDACMPKYQGEVLVYGSYYSPGGQPVTADSVKLTIGPIDKRLSVIGDRYWRTLLAPTDPEPFTELPISYKLAFGGKDYSLNPTGKGMDEVDLFGEMRLPMPNIEDADWLITSRDQRPNPAGFGPLDMMWEPRISKMGTYDKAWQQDYFPGYPLDIDWTHFNIAPEDQWIENFWLGNEKFHITNMHPDKPEVRGKLPEFRARCFIEKKPESGPLFTEVEIRPETVSLFPAEEIGIVIYRGTIEINEDDASDVEHILAAYEDMDEKPRSKEYYTQALSNRLDESKAFKYMMYTRDIIPASERCGFARILEDAAENNESELAKNMASKAEEEKQKAMEMLDQQKLQLQKKLIAANIDPAPYMAKFEVGSEQLVDPDMQDILQTVEEILPGSTKIDASQIRLEETNFSKLKELTAKMGSMAEAKKQEAKAQLVAAIEHVKGTRAEKEVSDRVEEALKKIDELPDLPRPVTDESLQVLKEQIKEIELTREKMRARGLGKEKLPEIDIPLEEIEQKIRESVESTRELYRSGAHYIEGNPPHQEPKDIIQYRFQKSLDKGESLSGRDLSGVDLSGLDLSGMDLSECYLEYCDLSNADLQGANLKRAIVTHANLRNANLTDADCRETNLGDSNFNGANLVRTRLENAELSMANLNNARIIDCDLHDVNFLETKMAGVDFSGSIFKATNFLSLDFSGGKFVGTQMIECNFLQSTLENTDFSAAHLCGSNFVECILDHSRFVEGNLTNVRFPAGCSLKHCNFDHANLDKVNMRDSEAEGSRFEYSTFNQADFSGANMQHTKFYGAEGKRALLMKTDLGGADFSSVNLMEGSLLKARLTNADLSYSNLYAVEFMNATVGGTDFSGANLDLTKLEDWRPDRDS